MEIVYKIPFENCVYNIVKSNLPSDKKISIGAIANPNPIKPEPIR